MCGQPGPRTQEEMAKSSPSYSAPPRVVSLSATQKDPPSPSFSLLSVLSLPLLFFTFSSCGFDLSQGNLRMITNGNPSLTPYSSHIRKGRSPQTRQWDPPLVSKWLYLAGEDKSLKPQRPKSTWMWVNRPGFKLHPCYLLTL